MSIKQLTLEELEAIKFQLLQAQRKAGEARRAANETLVATERALRVVNGLSDQGTPTTDG